MNETKKDLLRKERQKFRLTLCDPLLQGLEFKLELDLRTNNPYSFEVE